MSFIRSASAVSAVPQGERSMAGSRQGNVRAQRGKSFRFPTGVPVVFTWEEPGKGLSKGEGIAREVSATSAYVHSTTSPPVDAVVDVEILLPNSSGGSDVVLRAKMRTVRVERPRPGKKEPGFSVVAIGKGFVAHPNPRSRQAP
jgi:hypothetical protein